MNSEEKIKGAKELTSPCYVFDTDLFCDRIRLIQKHLVGRGEICFAMKANPFLVSAMEGLKIEVCSPGEFAICERAGIKPEQVVLSGVNKEENEINRVMKLYGSRITYTVESLNQFELLSRSALANNTTIRVLLRLSAENQFGMDEAAIRGLVSERDLHPEIQILGIQLYSGTQKKKMSKIQKELEMLDAFITSLQEQFGFSAACLEYGPGFYIPYFIDEEPERMDEVLSEFCTILDSLRFKGKITLEMGRYLAAPCGYYYTKIVDEKSNFSHVYGIADGGIHQLNYYGQMMAMKVPHYTQFDETGAVLVTDGEASPVANQTEKPGASQSAPRVRESVTLCGSLCTVNDILSRSITLSTPCLGTKIVFECCGAYSVTEGMALFLSRDLPRVYLFKGGRFTLVRDRVESNTFNGV